MTGKTHMMLGATVGVATAVNYPLEGGIVLVACAIFGSLIPDLDHPKSRLNQSLLPFRNKLFKMLVYLTLGTILLLLEPKTNASAVRLLGLGLIITGLSHHRSFTHSLFGLTVYSTIVYLGMQEIGLREAYIGFSLGYLTHLMADFVTKGGIEILYPCKKNFSFPITVKTGGMAERILGLGAGFYLMYFLINSL
jgi:inner membrane protein